MKSLFKLVVIALVFLLAVAPVAVRCADHPRTPPIYSGQSFTFGQAKAEPQGQVVTGYGLFVVNGLVFDSSNNTGNAFFGNTIVIRVGARRTVTYWYDWSADPVAVIKLAVWNRSTPLTFRYDARTLLVVGIN